MNLKTKLLLPLLLLAATPVFSEMEHHHGGMIMNEKGMVMNANPDKLPADCKAISETVALTIHAGHKYALKFNGKMFAFDQQQWEVKPCAKLDITFINDDEIRHQFMIHGLPGYLYPEGMFHLELYNKGKLKASLIVPGNKKTYLVHCELPQHQDKGMKAQLKVGGGDGDIPAIPGLTEPVRADTYPVDWQQGSVGLLLLCVLIGAMGPILFLKIKNKPEKSEES